MSNAYQLRRQKTANNVEVDFDNLAKEALEIVEGAVKRSFTQSNIVLRREIKRESLQLEKDFENLEKDKIIYKTQLKNVEDILKANTEIVRLDIGGVLYTTTAQTIRNQPGNLLHQIIERRVSAQIDDEGRIFIDRDGKRFGQLLDFMRNGTIQLPREIKERERLILEASFYNLDIMAGVDSSVIDHNVNLLNEVTMGGRAKVIGIYGVNSTVYNAGTMNGVHTANWPNNGCLFDEDRTRDDPNLSYRVNPGCGTTWVNSIPGSSIGVLVIDLGDVVPISQINVFSMRSDGQVTNVKFLSYPVDSGLPASATAYTGEFNGWQQVGSEVFVPRGHDVDANTVGGPATISFDQIQTRYLMMQARNDGSNGDPSYIEVRQIKAYP